MPPDSPIAGCYLFLFRLHLGGPRQRQTYGGGKKNMIQRSRIPGYSTQATALNLEELVASSCKQLFLRTNNFRPARSSKMIMSRCMVAVTYGPGRSLHSFLDTEAPRPPGSSVIGQRKNSTCQQYDIFGRNAEPRPSGCSG